MLGVMSKYNSFAGTGIGKPLGKPRGKSLSVILDVEWTGASSRVKAFKPLRKICYVDQGRA